MAYTPTVWETGDVITAEKLNNMECGIEAATPLILTETEDSEAGTYTLSETAGTIKTAFDSGRVVLLVHAQTLDVGLRVPVLKIEQSLLDESYVIDIFQLDPSNPITYVAATLTDYPVFTVV